jgi:peptide/nickel transport system substrate-binding protein
MITILLCTVVFIGCSSTETTTTQTTTAQPTAVKTATSASTSVTPAQITTVPATSAKTTTPATTSAPISQKYGGILRSIQAAAPGSPFGWPSEAVGGTMNAMQLCLYPLLDQTFGGDLLPLIAESYDVNNSPDKPSVTFHLKKNVKFHDGTVLDAKAVKWNLEQLTVGTMTTSSANWKSFDVLDDYTIRVNLTGWLNTMVASFAGPAASLVSPTAYEKNGLEWMRWNMVGAGAFKQVSYKRDVEFKMTKFNDYNEAGKPYLDGLQIIYCADSLTSLALFKSGGGDILSLGSDGRLAKTLQDSGFQVSAAVSGMKMLIPDSMNKNSTWANPKVRMAAEYAIDKESMASALGLGYWEPAYQPANKESKAYSKDIAGRKYDVAKAKQLLNEAGYPNGFKSTILAASTENKDSMMAIQANLKAVGIIVEIQYSEAPKYATYQMGTWSNALLVGEIPARPNFNATLSQIFDPNTTWYRSMKKPEGWAPMISATLTSPAQDSALMQKCIQALYDDATVIPLYWNKGIWATASNVHDAGLGARGSSTLWYAQNAWLGN